MTMRENLLLLRESISTTLRAASFPEPRLHRGRPHQLVCAVLQPAPHRGSAVDAPALRRWSRNPRSDRRFRHLAGGQAAGARVHQARAARGDRGTLLLDQLLPGTLRAVADERLTGDLMQSALQYACPFLITMGVEILDPTAMRTIVTANHVRATQNAESTMAKIMPDVAKKLQDWKAAADPRPGRPDRESVPPARALHHGQSEATTAEENAKVDLALPRLRAQQRRLHAPAVAHGEPADDAVREASTPT